MKRTIITLTIILLVSLNSLACIGLGSRPGETPSPVEQSLTIFQNLEKLNEEANSSMNNAQPAEEPAKSEPEQRLTQ